MQTFIFASSLLLISMFLMAIGVLFFGKAASRTACGVDPTKEPSPSGDKCATGEAGLCPFEDETGALKMANMNKLNK